MGFRLANIGGRAALVSGESYYDLEKISHGDFSQDPMEALEALSELSALDAQVEHVEPSVQLAVIELGPPVPNPKNCYAVGLNYRNQKLGRYSQLYLSNLRKITAGCLTSS